ncbi:hypothetical protein TNCV_3097311 [Trichonephila clavipes]|uniref:Uncharacterized protein n=1 Tax=Trichonephila clavipes TaxID=2585209 RepID=A0A8X6SND3_TRICX|nr:hypothetical protein TNCV_3097311 [Trichonephila clavipes]
MAAQWYVHNILQPHMLPLMQRPPGTIFQQDKLGLTRQEDFFRWRAVCRLEAGPSQTEVARSLKVARKGYPGSGINSKQVVLSPGSLLLTLRLCLEEEFTAKRSTVVLQRLVYAWRPVLRDLLTTFNLKDRIFVELQTSVMDTIRVQKSGF